MSENNWYNKKGEFIFSFKEPTIINPGDFIMVEAENIRFPVNLTITSDGLNGDLPKTLGVLQYQYNDIMDDFWEFFAGKKTKEDLLEKKPGLGNSRNVKITFNKIDKPIELKKFNFSFNNLYSNETAVSEPKKITGKIKKMNGELLFESKPIEMKNDQIIYEKADNRIFPVPLSLGLDQNNRPNRFRFVQTIFQDTFKKGKIYEIKLDENDPVYFRKQLNVGDKITGRVQQGSIYFKGNNEINKYDVIIPNQPFKDFQEFEVIESTPTTLKFQYNGVDTPFQRFIVSFNDLLNIKKEKENEFKTPKLMYDGVFKVKTAVYNDINSITPLYQTEHNSGIKIEPITTNYTGLNLDPVYKLRIRYLDEEGNSLSKDDQINNENGNDYNIVPKNIENYKFKKATKPLKGDLIEDTTIDLIYAKNKHNVTVKYIHRSENGEIEIKSPITKEYTVGDPLNIETPKINGYKYKESSEPINGKVGNEDKVIKLYYSKYIPGPQGDKGTQGDKGIPGDKGEKGGKGIEGAPGREGHTPDIRIDPKSGNWIVDGEDTGFRAIVFDGKDGKDGKDGNIDYNKVKIHYITPNGEIAKSTETVDKNKIEDKLKDEATIVAKEKDNSIIAVVPENNKEADNNRKEKEPLIKYNIISDKGEELTSSVYLQKGKELPNITIPGYKLLKTEKLSDTENRVIYSKDNSTSTKVELNNDITYRLTDENNQPISTVKYQDDKFQPALEGYKFKEKKVISEKEIVLVYQKDNIVNNISDNKIVKNQNGNSKESKDNTTISKENTKEEANSNISKQSDENKNTSTANNSVAKNAKIKSIIKAESGEMLETLYLDKDSKPEIKGYKYKETKVIDGNTQELIYTSESPNLRKADVKSGIDGVTSTTVGLFTSIIAVISAVIYRKRKE